MYQNLESSVSDYVHRAVMANTGGDIMSYPGWQAPVSSNVAQWMATYAREQHRTAPPGLEIVNGKWIEMLGYLNLAGADLQQVIAETNAGDTTDAIATFDTANTEVTKYLEAAQAETGLLQEFNAEHP